MLVAKTKKHNLIFKQPGGTSRGVLKSKDSWYILVFDSDYPDIKGIGECSLLRGLSIDDRPDFEQKLQEVCNNVENWQHWLLEGLIEFPAIRFGLEMAIKDLSEGGSGVMFPSNFTDSTDSIPINGLVWMGDYLSMRKRIIEKIESGYNCVKVKIGTINFDDELNLLRLIRNDFSNKDIELRLDANGAFLPNEALDKLGRLSEFEIHSIEQPIKQHQWEQLAHICNSSPIPVALDEELIGINSRSKVKQLLETVTPQYIILKPSLLGGWKQSNMFIEEAENYNIGWWVTSALEANVGLNAITQWVYTLNNKMHQGLGTGQLFTNNIPSPLFIKNAHLHYNNKENRNITSLFND